METKYYTPEIEEFHVGFEYELRHCNLGSGSKTTYRVPEGEFILENTDCTPWLKRKDYREQFGDYDVDSIDDLEEEIKKGNVRVKYLDKEDIEELGWTYQHDVDIEHIPGKVHEYGFLKEGLLKWKLRFVPTLSKVLITSHSNILRMTLEILNKSELKRIMKQLQILE